MARKRSRVPGGRQRVMWIRFTDEEFELIQVGAASVGVTPARLAAEAALMAARPSGAAVGNAEEVLVELRALRRLLQVQRGRVDSADAVAEAAARVGALLDRLEEAQRR